MSPVPNSLDGVSRPSEKEGISTVGRQRQGRVSAKRSPRFVRCLGRWRPPLVRRGSRVGAFRHCTRPSLAGTRQEPHRACKGRPCQVVRGGIGHSIACCSSPFLRLRGSARQGRLTGRVHVDCERLFQARCRGWRSSRLEEERGRGQESWFARGKSAIASIDSSQQKPSGADSWRGSICRRAVAQQTSASEGVLRG